MYTVLYYISHSKFLFPVFTNEISGKTLKPMKSVLSVKHFIRPGINGGCFILDTRKLKKTTSSDAPRVPEMLSGITDVKVGV
ncbi:hypothetical protein SUGI_0619880 [Cryptomeria japonica]|nr:hypothetical protein SUGI_0619880 [Cryptomeria japonica]